MSDSSTILPDAVQRGNIWRLSIAQALAGANSVVVFATGAIVGEMLAPTPMLATLPISIFVVGMAACTLPVGKIAQRHGRRTAFLAGTGAGVLTGILAMFAVLLGSSAWRRSLEAAMRQWCCRFALLPPMALRRLGAHVRCRWSWLAVWLQAS
jgi:MFS family permease